MFGAQVTALSPPSVDYTAILPVLIVLGAAAVGVLLEAFVPRNLRWSVQVTVSLVALAGAGIALGAYVPGAPAQGVTTMVDTLAIDAPALFLWGTLLALAFAALLFIAERTVEPGGAFVSQAALRGAAGGGGSVTTGVPGTAGGRAGAAPADGTRGMQTEVFPLTLFALGGMMTFVAANDLLTMFIALEVLSLPLYLMCGLARRRRLLSQESAVKYFLLGAFASAFFLYGVALLYGYAGSVRLGDIATAAAGSDRSDTLLFAGFGLLVVGLLFKGSVGPFHAWTPDVYQGAPTSVTGFMAACTKVAAFGAMLRVLYVGFEGTSWEWRGVLWAVAIVSMAVGAVLGLTQRDVKRMIAYSSIAHAGFLVIGVMTLSDSGLAATMFYLLAYGFTTLAAFAVVSLVRDADGEATDLSSWAGLAKRSPLIAGVFTFLLFALAGIPLTSGFVGKFVVFSAALGEGLAPLVVLALVFSAVAAFFYLRVVVVMYLTEPAAGGASVTVPGAFTTITIAAGTIVTLLLGIYPGFALEWAGAGGFAF
ncbi:NADH-quinone oxidoreductase subunit NuoN [Haloechinothrix sp. YIM 98757]|uniref:NADH-quinone oxidoreductase subunit N n=1 Tax=Haloechinothrix aidingensis TaxID=2752311 RepID=A0A837ZVH5_9PSEU|nr:NADH-quinone oxidoreductase subunit NuoN [Haloechinothrix aidingensis]MBA0124646.1 NADH-quinone oxidoreductase subunit NuoN [Haloechinothrix aidingensis]